MRELVIKPPDTVVKCEVILPASKSISNRLLIMRQLSDHKIEISNLSEAGDTQLMQKLIEKVNDARQVSDTGNACELDCENAGTVLRFLAAYLAVCPGKWVLTGSERMKQRPLTSLCQALRDLGASVQYLENEGFPPIAIEGKMLMGGNIRMDASESSQFASALAIIAPVLKNGLTIELQNEIASRPYLEMTLGLMKNAGIRGSLSERTMEILPGVYQPASFIVEPDWSAASYWYEIAAMMPGSEILLQHLPMRSLQGDAVLAEIYLHFGVSSYETGEGILLVNESEPQAQFSFDFTGYPDLVPAVAASCVALNIEARLSGLKNLVIKESNRLQALKNEIEKINPNIFIGNADTLHIGKYELKPDNPVRVQTYNDHRMAMALAPLSLCCGKLTIENPDVVAKSYPGFWDHLNKAGFKITNFNYRCNNHLQ